ncbi:CocE/NonD family hydrolase [bacterium]|nr:CocE/NonD family hydrolase [bacterium]
MEKRNAVPNGGSFPDRRRSGIRIIRVILWGGAILLLGSQNSAAGEKVSHFGAYQEYTEETHDDYIRTSDYLTLTDGTRLAYDLLLPANDGKAARDPLPVLFCHTSYLRAYNMVAGGRVVDNEIIKLNPLAKAFIWFRARLVHNGHIFDQAFMNPWLKRMLKHGYGVVIVEQRGTGASEGSMIPIFRYQAEDANEILDWIAAQPWSNGKIGMFGKSSLAMAQYAAASTGNPHLKAIFPVSSSLDMYGAVWFPGGILNRAFADMFSLSTGLLEKMAVPVDSDRDGTTLQAILKRRSEHFSLDKGPDAGIRKAPLRDSDSTHPRGKRIWQDLGIYTLLEQVNQSGIAIYNETGWFDIFARDGTLLHNNLTGNRKLLIRPLSHFALGKKGDDLDTDAEAHRWFDYWLKGIQNGIMDEPPIHYYVMGAPAEKAWQSATRWPLPRERRARFYFMAGPTPGNSPNGSGRLTTEPPRAATGFDTYRIDYSTTTGKSSRWRSIIQAMSYPDMSANDRKSMAYTTDPLGTDLEVTGHPVVYLDVSTPVTDMDLFVYLEAVDKKGRSSYVTEGCLRASHRALGNADFASPGLPFHPGLRADITPLIPDEPTILVFDLLPTAWRFPEGSRIRISIAGADADNFATPRIDPPPHLRIFRNSEHFSTIELPIIEYAGRP